MAKEQWGDEFNLFYIFLHKLLVTVRLHILSLKFQRFGLNQVEKMKSLEKYVANTLFLYVKSMLTESSNDFLEPTFPYQLYMYN